MRLFLTVGVVNEDVKSKRKFCRQSLSPQVKPCAVIAYKHTIYELPHELPNYLRLRLGN